MRPVPNEWTIVLVGNWNLAILNPSWVSKELFQTDPIKVDLVVGDTTQLRYSDRDITLTPRSDRVILGMTRVSDKNLARIEYLTCRLLELLPQTPLSASGINFGYEETDVPSRIAAIFDVKDTPNFANLDLVIKSTEIKRSFDCGTRQLNFRMVFQDGHLKFHFNFHKAVRAGPESVEDHRGKAAEFEACAERILTEVYQLELDQENV